MFWIIHLYIVHTIIVVQICILYYLLDSRSTRCDVFLVLINFFPFFVSKSPCERGLKKQKFFVSTTTKNRTNLHFQTRSSLRFLAALRRERNRTYTYRERKKKDASSRLRLYFFSVVSFLLFCRRWYVLRVGALDIHITFCPKGVNLKRTQKKSSEEEKMDAHHRPTTRRQALGEINGNLRNENNNNNGKAGAVKRGCAKNFLSFQSSFVFSS